MSRKNQWQPDANLEQDKLAPKESDWNLAGLAPATVTRTRTRFGGHGRPNLNTDNTSSCKSSSSDGSFAGDSDDDVSLEGMEEDKSKPEPIRIIIEVDQLKRTLEEFSKCKTCQGPMDVSLNAKGYGLATKIELSCLDQKCSFVHHGQEPAPTKVHADNTDSYDRITDYAVNCIYVISFIASGDGPTEAEKLLGLLGMPNDTTMASTTFKKIENRIGPFIRELGEAILLENVKKEVKASVDASDYDQWQRSIDPTIACPPLPVERYPVVDGSFDNGWQQKKSGHTHDSPSGHGLIFGFKTRLPLCYEIKSKLCDFCNHQKKKYPDRTREEYNVHDCCKNYEGSSGAMEALTCLELVTRLFDVYQVQIGRLCCDDDSSVRADCQWDNATYLRKYDLDVLPQVKITRGINKGKLQDRLDKGKLKEEINEPKFVSDPNHRGKLFTGEMIAVDLSSVASKVTMTRMDTTRLGKNFKYMGRTLKHKDPNDYVQAGRAVLDHHFDIHTDCDASWCRRKNETADERLKSKRYYRDRVKDKALYKKIEGIISKYITQERLLDIAHGMDTNANESFNNTVAWIAPKNKVYCGSRSLWNRVCIAIGMVSLGPEEFYKRLFKALGIQLTANVLHYLKTKDRQRSKRLTKLKTSSKKLARNKRKFDKLQKDTLIAKKERLARAGKYKKGMNVDVTVEEEATLRVRKLKEPTVCKHPFCGLKGHTTTRAKGCKANPKRLEKEGTAEACAAAVVLAAAAAAAVDAVVAPAAAPNLPEFLEIEPVPLLSAPSVDAEAQDIDRHEAVPLDGSDGDSSLELYEEAATWSEDEDGNIL